MKVTLCSLLQFLCLILATILPCHSSASSNETPDYAEGFLKFQQMTGITTQSMKYVKITDTWPYDIDPVLPYPKETSGNAWMVSEEIDEKGNPISGVFIVNGAERVKIYNQSFSPSSGTTNFMIDITKQPEICGQWRAADYQEDINTTTTFFEWLKHEKYPKIYLKSDNIARIFIFACRISQQGKSEDANLIVDRLFTCVGKEKTIRHALTYTASCEYENLYRQFTVNHDWDTYSLGIQHLLDSYGKTWKAYDAMQYLGSRVTSVALHRSKHKPDTQNSASLDGAKAIDPGDMQFIYTRTGYKSLDVLWLLPETWVPGSHIATEDIDLAIRSRGMSAISCLLECAKDGRLTNADASRVRVDLLQYRFRHPGQSRFPQILRDLNRPATRREIAVRILYEMLLGIAIPSGKHLSDADVVSAATNFHAKHKHDSPHQMALLYISKNGVQERILQTGVNFLLSHSTENRSTVLEDLILNRDLPVGYRFYHSDASKEADDRARILVRYAALRNDGRRELVKTLTESVDGTAKEYTRPRYQDFGSPEANEQHEVETRDKTRAVAERLRRTRFDLPITTMLSQIQALNEDSTTYDHEVLMARLLTMETGSAVKLLLDEAARSPTNRTAMAEFITSFMYETDLGLVGKADYRKLGCVPSDNAEAWKTLISDETPVPDSDQCVADRFLCINEQMFSFMGEATRKDDLLYARLWFRKLPIESSPALEMVRLYGRQGRQLLRERVMDRLDGKDEKSLPEFPSATTVSTGPREYLQSTLTSLSSREAAEKAVDNFDVTTLAAMPVFLLENNTINRKLTRFANTIVSVNAKGDDNETAQFQQWKDKALTPEKLTTLKDFCMQKTSEGIPVVCTVTRQRNFGGCNIVVAPLDRNDTQLYGQELVGMTGLVCGWDLYGAASWRTAPLPLTLDYSMFVTTEPDEIRDFETRLNYFCGDRMPASSEGAVKFQSKEKCNEDNPLEMP